MNFSYRGKILLISLWIHIGSVPGIHCSVGTVNHLSREDILLFKDEQNPKCFTRTQYDFTCFFETFNNNTYDLLYRVSSEKRCEMSVHGTVQGTFLHTCSFPRVDVLLYVEIHLDVVACNTNTSLYKRTVSVEDHFLLDPPSRLSLQQNDQAGQLQVSWQSQAPKYFEDNMMYMIRYSSKGLGVKTKEAKEGDILDSLVPGEEVEVQVTAKCALNPSAGHWSSWSHPARTVVPQSADDVSLICYTSDLQNVTCQWNGNRYGAENEYKLFYKMDLRDASSWTEWAECLVDTNWTDQRRFQGDESRKVRVKLKSSLAPLSRTFYTQEFTLNNSIKTTPPSHLERALEKDKLCFKWKSPLRSLSAHLQYEVSYQIKGGEAFMMVSLNNPEACVEVPPSSQYSIKVRAKPIGIIYSGHWSDWSQVLTGDTPADRGTFLLLSIPVVMLIAVIILILLFPKYPSKLKLYFWPPVPNLDKVLQSYLSEINGQRWIPPLTAKQCSEDTTPSVVEIMSEAEVSGLGKPSYVSTHLLSPQSCCSSEISEGSPGSEVFPDYVTLSKDIADIHCPKENTYVYEYNTSMGEKEGLAAKDEFFQTRLPSCIDGSVYTPLCSGNDFLNHSYMPQLNRKVTEVRGPSNLYTNLPCS